MATKLEEVVDIFMTLQDDYRLQSVFSTSGSAILNTTVEPWLLISIDHFSPYCNQSLDYDTTTQTFTETLYPKNIRILAQIMVLYWLERVVQNLLQMNNNIQDHDFKTWSQAQNLLAKKEFLNTKREEISQLLIDYGYQNNDWAAWINQDFAGVL